MILLYYFPYIFLLGRGVLSLLLFPWLLKQDTFPIRRPLITLFENILIAYLFYRTIIISSFMISVLHHFSV